MNKVKSGKYARVNINLQRQEVWPHTTVSKKYAKRTTFDNLEFEQFMAGESKIIFNMLAQENTEAMGRLRVMTLVAHWQCKCKNWPIVRNLYESIMEEIELGERTWNDDFTQYEMMLPNVVSSNTMQVPVQNTVAEKSGTKKPIEVYWCKNFQTKNCELNPPHLAQIKPDESPVPVLHICANCWSNGRKCKEHAKIDCNVKK